MKAASFLSNQETTKDHQEDKVHKEKNLFLVKHSYTYFYLIKQRK